MIYDVSVPITNQIPVWPTDPPVKLRTQTHPARDKSHNVRVTGIEMGAHTGTHIDAPWHMMENGRTLKDIPLDTLIGPAQVVQITGTASISRAHVEGFNWTNTERVLFKTENSEHWNEGRFYEEFVYLEPEAAELLVKRGIRLVGIDYLSIDRFKSESHPSHFVLLEKNVVIVEGLDLSRVPPGRYEMIALPLNLQDVDGAPARVILTNNS
jgi:arylformamidase